MRIASWNVNSIKVRLPQLTEWLKRAEPDIVCLQETKVTTEDFPFDPLGELGYEAVAYGTGGYNGVAILSKFPINEPVEGFTGEEGHARLIEASIEGMQVFSVYVPNGASPEDEKFKYKLRFFKALRQHLASVAKPTSELVIAGDFNVAPEERDVWNPKIAAKYVGFHPLEHAALKELTSWGLKDSLRLHDQRAGQYSWWDYRTLGFQKDEGMRIDQIWLTEPLAKRCTAASIDLWPRRLEKPSDHTPVICEID
ncbi:MAG: exodeoxyribonuclease III [Planctomycetes bacterium]|nr:exodeoxyribonuclease III [Planctomycetota bacterium]